MHKQSIAIQKIIFTLFFIGLVSANLTTTLCWGSDKVSANPTITLDVANEPLKGVLGKISKTTGWKIKAPEKWMEKPVTQTLNRASMEEGLRSILKNAGIENLLLMYNEDIRVVTIFDTESAQGQSAGRSPAQVNTQTQAVSANLPPTQLNARTPGAPATEAPILNRSIRNKPSLGIRRGSGGAIPEDE